MYELKVNGMTCGHCVGVVTETVKTLDPAANVSVELPLKRVQIVSKRSREDIIKALGEAGYPAESIGAAK